MPPLSQFLHVFILLLPLLAAEPQDPFQCPSYPITANGSFPIGYNGPTIFPQLYNCTIEFEITRGYVVHLVASKTAGSPGYPVTITDTLSKTFTFSKRDDDDVIDVYLPATNGTLSIVTQLENAFFFFTWQFLPCSSATVAPSSYAYAVGTAVDLNLVPFQPAVFFNNNNSPIAFRLERNCFTDVYVYDGFSPSGDYLGTTNSGANIQPTRSAVTIVTYQTRFTCAALPVYQYDISSYQWFNFAKVDANTYHQIVPRNGALTIMSPFPVLTLTSVGIYSAVNESIEIKRGFPSTSFSYDTVLSYPSTNSFNASMPQQIRSRLFTITTKRASYSPDIYMHVDDSNSEQVSVGSKASIMPASFWDQNATANYDRTFVSSSIVTFNFNLESLYVQNDNENLHIEVGGGSGNPSTWDLGRSSSRLFPASVNGTYMKVAYTGSSSNSTSKFRIDYEVTNPNEQPTTAAPTTTTTTTTSSTQKSAPTGASSPVTPASSPTTPLSSPTSTKQLISSTTAEPTTKEARNWKFFSVILTSLLTVYCLHF